MHFDVTVDAQPCEVGGTQRPSGEDRDGQSVAMPRPFGKPDGASGERAGVPRRPVYLLRSSGRLSNCAFPCAVLRRTKLGAATSSARLPRFSSLDDSRVDILRLE